jgi:signal transduction histidine kinase
MTSLFARLSLAFTGILLVLSLSVLWLSHKNSQDYFLEFTQQLNAPIAMYMAENIDFVDNNVINPLWLQELAPHVMMINPSVEVYLLDQSGTIIGSSPENTKLAKTTIDLQPISDFLQEDRTLPITGDDPKHATEQRIFSAFPLYTHDGSSNERSIAGYIYAVVAGKQYQSVIESLSNSYSFKNLVMTLSGAMLLALLSGVMVFMMLTRRLKILAQNVSIKANALTRVDNQAANCSSRKIKFDEIDKLAFSYQSMANKLMHQYAELEEKDTNRREFIANISHDLRTPLTTMQSYLETLQLKDHTLSQEEKQDYLRIAYRQSKHLRKLVAQLFTLTKLESGEVSPSIEAFSLLELANDTAQEFQIKARSRGINLHIEPQRNHGSEFDVRADIGMIHRVFENLVGNAIRHTPSGGDVIISLDRLHNEYVDIAFIDTGCGMSKEQCKQVMSRYYTGAGQTQGMGGPTGLGLAIVKNILALHDAAMTIESQLGKGTTIRFRIASSTPTLKAKHRAPNDVQLVV